MAATNQPAGPGLAPKVLSDAVFAAIGKTSNIMNTLAGPAPGEKGIYDPKVAHETTSDMPIMRVHKPEKRAGDTIQINCIRNVKVRAVMGDKNAKGKGAALSTTSVDQRINMATLPVDAGGKMTQQRTPADNRRTAGRHVAAAVPRFIAQRAIVQLAGARGQQDNIDWVLGLQDDPNFADEMVVPLKAPTYNRHFVIDGADIVQGGQQLGVIDATDRMKLSHIDGLMSLINESPIRMMRVRVPGDELADDSPLKGIIMLDDLVFDGIIQDNTNGNNIRQWQSNALERAKAGKIGDHRLFAPGSFLWGGFLVRAMGAFSVRFNADGTQAPRYVKAADRYTGTESADVTIPNLTASGKSYRVARSLVLTAQALSTCTGTNAGSGLPYTMLEDSSDNFGRELSLAAEIIGSEMKLRFDLPDGAGNFEPTDFGVAVIDSVVPRLFD